MAFVLFFEMGNNCLAGRDRRTKPSVYTPNCSITAVHFQPVTYSGKKGSNPKTLVFLLSPPEEDEDVIWITGDCRGCSLDCTLRTTHEHTRGARGGPGRLSHAQPKPLFPHFLKFCGGQRKRFHSNPEDIAGKRRCSHAGREGTESTEQLCNRFTGRLQTCRK